MGDPWKSTPNGGFKSWHGGFFTWGGYQTQSPEAGAVGERGLRWRRFELSRLDSPRRQVVVGLRRGVDAALAEARYLGWDGMRC